MTITQHQKALLENALYAAALVYKADSETFEQAGNKPMSDQFKGQQEQAIQLAEAVEACDFVRFEHA